MKILFAIMPGAGHFNPMAPLGRALTYLGHEVAFACAPSFLPAVEAAGFRAFPAGVDWQHVFADHLPDGNPSRFAAQQALAMGNPSSGMMRQVLGTFAESSLPELLAIGRDWEPDLIVRGPMVLGAALAAEVLDIPQAVVLNGLLLPQELLKSSMLEQINALRVAHGLEPDPELRSLREVLHISLAPPSFQRKAEDIRALHFIRPLVEDQHDTDRLPEWVDDLPKRPTVYVTLGTVFNQAPGIFETILAGLHDEDLNVIVTIGRAGDPAQLGPQPEHIHIERYIPMTALLEHCDAVVAHGGFNTVMTTLSHGLPLLVVPISADQPFNAQRCAELGVGLQIPPAELTPEAVRTAVRSLLEQPEYRERAHALQAEIAALPGVERAVELLTGRARGL